MMNTSQILPTALALTLSVAGVSAQQWSTNTLPPGLVAWWAAEGSATDSTANHHDATVSGGVSYLAAQCGTGFAFDGIDGVVEVPDSPELRLTDALSIEFWAKRQRDGIDLVLEKGGDWNIGGEPNYGVGLHSIHNWMFYFFFRGGWRGTSGVADFNWHHYAVIASHGAANPELYIDGVARPVEFSEGAATVNLYPSSRPLHIGAQVSPGYNYYGNNMLDDLRIYNRALAAAEVSYLYQGPSLPSLQIQSASPSSVTLSWATLADKAYQLQSVTSLPAVIWLNEGTPFAGTGGVLTTSIPIWGELTKFFRLEVLTTPITPPVIVPGNLLPNSSLETVSPANSTLPDQWFTERAGANDAVFSYQNTGHTGNRSMKVQMTSYTNGAAELVHHAVPVTGNRQYTFSDHFQSDVYTEIDAEINLSDDTTEYVYVGYTWPSASWNKFSAVLTMPADAVSLVVYHILTEAGYLATDDYALVQNPSTPPTGFNRAIVSLTFDDGLSSHYCNAAPILDANGQHATFYAVSSWVGQPDYMTVAQMSALLGSGHEIGGHSATHAHLTTLDATTLNEELQQCQSVLEQNLGTPIVSFAPPYGEYNDPVIANIRQYYESQRSTDVGFNTRDGVNPNNLLVQNVNRNVSAASVQSWVDQAIQNSGWLILVYHDISPDGDSFSTTPTNLSTELNYIKNSGVTVLTVKQALAETLVQ